MAHSWPAEPGSVPPPSAGALRVQRVLGNNAALCETSDGQQVVALGRGLGSGRRRGELLDPEAVEQFFVAGSPDGRQQLATLLAELPLDSVRAATAIAELAHTELGLPVTQSLILPLADHLAFAERRVREHLPVTIPWPGRSVSSTRASSRWDAGASRWPTGTSGWNWQKPSPSPLRCTWSIPSSPGPEPAWR